MERGSLRLALPSCLKTGPCFIYTQNKVAILLYAVVKQLI